MSLRAGSGLWRLAHYVLIFVAALAVAKVAVRLGVPSDLAVVGSMLLALLGLCAVIEAQRYRLRIRLAGMDEDERRRLARHEPEVRYSRPLWRGKSYIVTMLVGQLVVHGPMLPIFIAPVTLTQLRFAPNDYPFLNFLAVVAGSALACLWWRIGGVLWRGWALRYRDIGPDELQWRGESGLLLRDASAYRGKKVRRVRRVPKGPSG